MNYTELKKSYDTVRREQLNADKELTRISKELKDLQQQYDSIDSTYEKSEASFRNKELELFRNKVILIKLFMVQKLVVQSLRNHTERWMVKLQS